MVYKWINFIQSRLPGHCLMCGARCPAGDGLDLCAGCRRDLPLNSQPCPACGEPQVGANRLCGGCLQRPPACDRTIAPLLYAPPLDTLVQRMKSPGGIVVARTLGRLLAQLLASGPLDRPQLLVPIPLHSSRLRERGFNQATLLARQVSRQLDIAWHAGILEKRRQTEDQRGLDRRARRRNLRGSFDSRELPAGCHVAIVDDVVTTGATCQEAATTLKRAGAGRVDVWALARTP